MHDNQQLRSEVLRTTSQVADWKDSRSLVLLNKLLELEEPYITPKMVDYLYQQGVTEKLVSFITQAGSANARPGRNDDSSQSHEMKLAYKAVIILTCDEPSEATLNYLGKVAQTIVREIFDIFKDDSAGSFYHAYRIIGCLLRNFPTDVYEALCNDGKLPERMSAIFRYIGHTPVSELLVMIVALTPLPRASQLYLISAKSRWTFFEQLNQWDFMLKLTQIVVRPADICHLGHICSAEQHSNASCLAIQELIEKLSLEDMGEILFQSIGFTPALLDSLVDAIIDDQCDPCIRRSCCRLINFIIKSASEPEIFCFFGQQVGATVSVSNRFHSIRANVTNAIRRWMPQLAGMLKMFHSNADDEPSSESYKYSSYVIHRPFSVLRSYLMELIVLAVETDCTVAALVSSDLWKIMFKWTVIYAHNNIYHSMIYRLIFAILRGNDSATQSTLLQDAGLIRLITDYFVAYPNRVDCVYKTQSTDVVNKSMVRGFLLKCANLIRLQSKHASATPFLVEFLGNNKEWADFEPTLITATSIQINFGMGIRVDDNHTKMNHNVASLMHMTPESKSYESELGLGSWYSKSIGFVDDADTDGAMSPASMID